MSESSLLLSGVILPDREALGPMDVLLSDRKIVRIGPAGQLTGDREWQLPGLWLLPGVVDAHVHPIHAETFHSVGNQSVSGGITTVLSHLYPAPDETFPDAVARATAEAGTARADFGFHLRLTPDRLTPLRRTGTGLPQALVEASRCPGVLSAKAFLSHSDSTVLTTTRQLVQICAATAVAELPLIVHAEPGDVLQELETLIGRPESLVAHDRLRAPDLEAASVAMSAAIARAVGARLYIAHMSSELAVDAASHARGLGTRIKGETCMHYLDLSRDIPLGSAGRVTPPLRSDQTVHKLRQRVADPTAAIDVIASDHCGYPAEEKPVDDFAHAGNGLPGLDSLLPLLLDAVISDGWLSAQRMVAAVCAGPADTFGLRHKGRVAVGADADLVVVDPSGCTDLLTQPGGPRSAASPYAGRRLSGRILHVIRRGATVVLDGAIADDSQGQPVEREVPKW